MANNNIVIVGNLTADPELKFTPSGAAVASFSVASTERKFDRGTNAWVDGDTTFMRVSAWRDLGEHIAHSLKKGDKVIVTGRLKSNVVEKDGQKTTYFEVEAEHVGPSLEWATAVVTRVTKNGGGLGNGQAAAPQAQAPQQSAPQAAPAAQPQQYAQPAQAGGYQGDF